ncbi:MAG: hypothetical protein KF708_11715 [Pirellulales bacterium]|nr:hypothetical protein [Pirellulales bacterium]
MTGSDIILKDAHHTVGTLQDSAAVGDAARASRDSLYMLKLLGIPSLVAISLVAGVCLWAAQKTGSMRAGLAYLRGDRLFAAATGPIQWNGDTATRQASGTIEIANFSDEAIRIVGYNNPCLCVRIVGLPLVIRPHERVTLVVEGKAGSEERTASVEFLTDDAVQPRVPVNVVIPLLPSQED